MCQNICYKCNIRVYIIYDFTIDIVYANTLFIALGWGESLD